jgi:tol-pal system protein YbgF
MRIRSLITLAAGCAFLAACATPSDIQKLQGQVSELQEQLAQVKRTSSSKEEVQNVNSRIVEQTATLLKSNAALVAKVDQIDEKINNAQGSNEMTGNRLDRMAQQLTQAQHDVEELKAAIARLSVAAAAAPTTANTPSTQPQPAMSEVTVPAPAAPGETPTQIYQTAYRDYQRGNFDLAISGFREFMQRYPTSDLADNASYWIAESLFSQKKYPESIEQFDTVVNKYPKSDKVPGALLKKAYAYLAINDKARAIVQLQYVVHEHPNAQEASLARQKLRQLGVDSK